MKRYDIVVVGGGTAGCAAAYTAGKLGFKTLLIEKNIHLGGTMTSALVVPAMKSGEHQINTDFYRQLVLEMKTLGGQVTYQGNSGWFNPELMKIALDKMMQDTGVEVFFDTHILDICHADGHLATLKISKEILSVYNDTLDNLKEKLSVSIGTRYVIDATGNCEIAKLCGCDLFEEKDEHQPVSLRFMMSGVDLEKFSSWLEEFDKDRNVTTVERIGDEIHLSTAYTWDKDKNWALAPLFEEARKKGLLKSHDANYFQIFTVAGMPGTIAFNCPRIVDYTDTLKVKNMSKALILGRQIILRLSKFCNEYFPGFEKAYVSNIADMLGIRVSRRLKGKYVTTIDDVKKGKKFSNPVVISDYPVDVHSKKRNASTLDMVKDYQLPVESLMTKEFDNLFVVGRCFSADFMAQGALRVQASCFSMGEGIVKYLYSMQNKED